MPCAWKELIGTAVMFFLISDMAYHRSGQPHAGPVDLSKAKEKDSKIMLGCYLCNHPPSIFAGRAGEGENCERREPCAKKTRNSRGSQAHGRAATGKQHTHAAHIHTQEHTPHTHPHLCTHTPNPDNATRPRTKQVHMTQSDGTPRQPRHTPHGQRPYHTHTPTHTYPHKLMHVHSYYFLGLESDLSVAFYALPDKRPLATYVRAKPSLTQALKT